VRMSHPGKKVRKSQTGQQVELSLLLL